MEDSEHPLKMQKNLNEKQTPEAFALIRIYLHIKKMLTILHILPDPAYPVTFYSDVACHSLMHKHAYPCYVFCLAYVMAGVEIVRNRDAASQ